VDAIQAGEAHTQKGQRGRCRGLNLSDPEDIHFFFDPIGWYGEKVMNVILRFRVELWAAITNRMGAGASEN
jgi:hypothetical protein